MNNYLHHFSKGSHTVIHEDYISNTTGCYFTFLTNEEVVARDTEHHMRKALRDRVVLPRGSTVSIREALDACPGLG